MSCCSRNCIFCGKCVKRAKCARAKGRLRIQGPRMPQGLHPQLHVDVLALAWKYPGQKRMLVQMQRRPEQLHQPHKNPYRAGSAGRRAADGDSTALIAPSPNRRTRAYQRNSIIASEIGELKHEPTIAEWSISSSCPIDHDSGGSHRGVCGG